MQLVKSWRVKITGKIIDGRKIAEELRKNIAKEVDNLKSKYNMTPNITTIKVGDDPPSNLYLRLRDKACEEVGIKSPEDILKFAIVTIPENSAKMTANLQGPLIINRKTRVGRQSINNDPRWKVRHVIMEELAELRQETC